MFVLFFQTSGSKAETLNTDVSRPSRNRNVEIGSQHSLSQEVVVSQWLLQRVTHMNNISLLILTEDIIQVTFSLLKGMFANVS